MSDIETRLLGAPRTHLIRCGVAPVSTINFAACSTRSQRMHPWARAKTEKPLIDGEPALHASPLSCLSVEYYRGMVPFPSGARAGG